MDAPAVRPRTRHALAGRRTAAGARLGAPDGAFHADARGRDAGGRDEAGGAQARRRPADRRGAVGDVARRRGRQTLDCVPLRARVCAQAERVGVELPGPSWHTAGAGQPRTDARAGGGRGLPDSAGAAGAQQRCRPEDDEPARAAALGGRVRSRLRPVDAVRCVLRAVACDHGDGDRGPSSERALVCVRAAARTCKHGSRIPTQLPRMGPQVAPVQMRVGAPVLLDRHVPLTPTDRLLCSAPVTVAAH